MANDTYYLTTGYNPNGNGLIAVITLGSPQLGDSEVIVCDVELVRDEHAAQVWFEKQILARPWEKQH